MREEEEKGEGGGRGWPGGDGWGGTQTAGDRDSQRGAGIPRRRNKGDPGTENQGDGDPGAERDQGEAPQVAGKRAGGRRGLRTAPSLPPGTLFPVQTPALLAKQTWAESELHRFLVATVATWRGPPPI